MRSLALAIVALSTVAHAADPPDLRPETRIQRRFVDKKGHFSAYVGFAYHGRGDFYRSPGIEVAASYYFLEPLAAELRASWFFSSPTDELTSVEKQTGYLPDSRPSQASVLLGARWSLGYAKLRVTSHYVLHFEPQLFLYGGILVASGQFSTGTQVEPLGLVGLGFLIHFTPRLQGRLDAGLTVGGEQRTTYVAVIGGYPVLSLGVRF